MKKKTSPKKNNNIDPAPKDGIKPSNSTIPTLIKYTNVEDCFAAEEGDTSSMGELVRRAREDDKNYKSFMALIKLHTATRLADKFDDTTCLLYPIIEFDKAFYEQDWVQKKLLEGMQDQGNEGDFFRKKFWQAVFSNTKMDHLRWATQDEINAWLKKNKTEKENGTRKPFKQFIVRRRDKWNKELRVGKISFEDILIECLKYGVVGEDEYRDAGVVGEDEYKEAEEAVKDRYDLDSFRKYLNIYGVSGKRGRPKGSKKRK